MKPSEQIRDATESEFFRRETAIASLVRESIQNSLDAALGAEQIVTVRFCIKRNSPRSGSEWFQGLSEHISACPDSCDAAALSLLDTPPAFLVVEDFGTRGLCGSTEGARRDELGEGSQDFYYFWRNVGRTAKKGANLGSWGLGKAVYCASSQIRSVIGWTIREDGRKLVMGQSVLAVHDLATSHGSLRQHDAYGFWGAFGARPDDEDFCTPIEDGETIEKLRSMFCLARSNEPGFSLVVPFPSTELVSRDDASENVARSFVREAVVQFAYPLLAGRLRVIVCVDDFERAVDSAAIVDSIDWLGLPEDESAAFAKYIDLCQWALASPTPVALTRDNGLAARWEHIDFSPLASCRDMYSQEQPVAVRVPVLVRPKDADKTVAWFTVYLRSAPTMKTSIVRFVRQGLTLTEAPTVQMSGVVGLVLIDDVDLARLLRAAENPAHTKWLDREERLVKQFIGGADRVKFVEQAPRILLKHLLGGSEERDVDLLSDYFPEVDPDSTRRTGGATTRRKGSKTDLPRPIPPAPPRPFRTTKCEGGFVVTRNRLVACSRVDLLVQVAFDCVGSNPFSAWEEYDFDVAKPPIRVAVTGGDVRTLEGNRICVAVQNDDFSLTVTGFDETRDVAVRYRVIKGPSATGASATDFGDDESEDEDVEQ